MIIGKTVILAACALQRNRCKSHFIRKKNRITKKHAKGKMYINQNIKYVLYEAAL